MVYKVSGVNMDKNRIKAWTMGQGWLIGTLIMLITYPLLGQEVPKTLPVKDHPRILLLKGEESMIKKNVETDPRWENLHTAIMQEAQSIIHEDVLERKQIGRRLLSVSREALRRIFYLSYAYRMSGEQLFLKRAEEEMLAVSRFSDWNPSHFLDVAEMTMALSIGYDWLFDGLSKASKRTIKDAIVQLGIKPSYDEEYNWFLSATHNWNQVCNAGMLYGALAIYEEEPELAHKTIHRAVETISLAMEDYQPDGAYPEGYGYWAYGTTFNVLFLDAIERIYSTDFGLNEVPGFLETAGFFKNMSGVTGYSFNWGDAGGGRGSITPAMYWFAEKNQEPSLLWVERGQFDRGDLSRFTSNRILPAAMIWGKNFSLDKIPVPERKVWVGQGANPLALMRTSWTDPNAIYLGFKAGSASVNHGHMDIGSFIMEANGVRWAMDFGSQNYESLESKGIALFGRTQDAERWSVFRLNNFVHNTLTFDGELQRVDGYAKIDKYGDEENLAFAQSDISTVYKDQVEQFQRGVAIVDQAYVLVRDEINNKSGKTHMRWNMLTSANVEVSEDGATLTKDGKTLTLRMMGLENVKWQTYSTTPTTDYDAPNPGTIMVGFEYEAEADENINYEVYLLPEGTTPPSQMLNPLKDW
ncbi:heparinase II/III domain-containing protein [Pleomorphovibrio marinus]|uniref:heparinase II/III domain-containing protein n=1 Tax=Pleomorphovibrio marinus TaxID=2164132 RepID=UPI000E0C3B16|nr:heparinase II/III family protein [Pleomorphovibrio marinus]